VHGFLATPNLPPAPQYSVRLLYDPTKAKNSGSTLPVKLQLYNAAGANVSAPSVVLHATAVVLAGAMTSWPVIDAGNANPNNDFCYDASLSGYIFNLKTTGLPSGAYDLQFTAGGDPTVYKAPFEVK
jgi:hypothetical protein